MIINKKGNDKHKQKYTDEQIQAAFKDLKE